MIEIYLIQSVFYFLLGILSKILFSRGYMSFSEADFKKALSLYGSGVTVVTYNNEGIHSGITVSAFSSVSLDPPLVMVCLNQNSPAIAAIEKSKKFNIHFLSSTQKDISNTFAKNDSSRMDYLKSDSLEKSSNGIPKIPNSLCTLECALYAKHIAGDHSIILGRVEQSKANEANNVEPLLYYNKNYRTIKDL
jgi:flavin reductase (DIM6/NTAB) family NADH-FMN oxidoreductase RutF